MVNYFFYMLVSLTLAGLSAFMVKKLAVYAAGSGLAEIKVCHADILHPPILGVSVRWCLLILT